MTKKSLAEHSQSRILTVATEYLSAHHDQEVSVSEAAAAAGVGTRTLQIVFQKALNTTPGTWLLKLRLRRARQMLLAPEDGTSVASAAHGSGLHHLGRFSQYYREEFGEPPSETLKGALKLRPATRMRASGAIPTSLKRNLLDGLPKTDPTSEEKAMTSIECGQLFSNIEDMIVAWERVHAILSGRLNYKRGAVILKRTLDGRPLIFSHCRGGMEDDRFCADMNRVNFVLASARGIVHSVLQEGIPRIENDLDLVVDYAALDASIRSELCVPLVSAGEVVGAINFESDNKNAFDLYDLVLASAISSATVGKLQTARSSGSLGLSDRA